MEAEQKLVDKIMDPANDLLHMTKEEFQEILERENIFKEVADRIF